MKVTTNNLERLAKNLGYSPEKIGIAVLNALGYKTKKAWLGDVSVMDKSGEKLLYYWDSGVNNF